MKKAILMICLLTILSLGASALALTDGEVESAARLYLPEEARLQKIEQDDGAFEATFIIEATNEKFEVKVDPDTGKVVKLESEVKGAKGSKAASLTEEQIAQTLQMTYPGAEILRSDEIIDDGFHEMEVFFRAEGIYGTLELNAETGVILERSLYWGEYQEGGLLTEAAARAALASLKPDAAITKLKLKEDDGESFWKGEATMNGSEYEFTIHAVTGALIEWGRD